MVESSMPHRGGGALGVGLLLVLLVGGCAPEPTELLTLDLFASEVGVADPFAEVELLVFRVKSKDLTDVVVKFTEFSLEGGRSEYEDARLPSRVKSQK